MAGKSSRFFNEGYDIPKYMLPLNGNSNVFKESVKSFQNYFKTDFFLFITRSDFEVKDFVEKECNFLGIKNFEIVSLDNDTRGQADTVKIGLQKTKYNKDEEIYIFNIDSIRVNFTKPTSTFLTDSEGYLEVFEGEGDHWSFIEADKNNLVKRTTEKIRISNLCSNGLYYFSSVSLFNQTFNNIELDNIYNELFIAPMYNHIIKLNNIVKYRLLDKTQTLFSGTPSEYKLLLKNQSILK